MTDTTTITPEERAEWRERLESPFSCHDSKHGAFTLRLLDAIEAAAIAAWNSLPRRPDYNDVDCAGCPERRHSALTWTTEPPKVVGRFWWRDDRHPNEADILNVTQTTLEWFQHNRLCPHEQFAGPIPEPKE